jgi:hypothetical protein
MHILVHIYMLYNIFTHLDRISCSITGYQLVSIKLMSRYIVELVFFLWYSACLGTLIIVSHISPMQQLQIS